ncbi:MAG: TetR/AcrR family transcriptional regulator, partial [Chloroflexi bacterium]|nr:TetR/AcrR family transcriptional regulator [Chloroflexota bacterium]
QGLLYSHFASKDDLLRAIFQQSVQNVFESFALAEEGDPSRSLVARIIVAAFAVLRANRDFWRLSYGVRMQQPVLAVLGPELSDWTASIRTTMERALRQSGVARPEIEAAILFATIDGVAQHYVLDPEHYPLDAVVEALTLRYA